MRLSLRTPTRRVPQRRVRRWVPTYVAPTPDPTPATEEQVFSGWRPGPLIPDHPKRLRKRFKYRLTFVWWTVTTGAPQHDAPHRSQITSCTRGHRSPTRVARSVSIDGQHRIGERRTRMYGETTVTTRTRQHGYSELMLLSALLAAERL